jgi:hypothetical protein
MRWERSCGVVVAFRKTPFWRVPERGLVRMFSVLFLMVNLIW